MPKNEFSLPYSKYNGFFNTILGSGPPFWELTSDKHRSKNELDLEIVFFVVDVWSFGGPFWEPKRGLRGDV